MTTTTEPRWAPPRPATTEEKTNSLRHALIWIFIMVQGLFATTFIGVYAIAQSEMNGDPFNDLGVTIGREMLINELTTWWMVGTFILTTGFAALYFGLKGRWTR
jgi:uncharacterized BrkB/YihY/UPF0761 family membrane protein